MVEVIDDRQIEEIATENAQLRALIVQWCQVRPYGDGLIRCPACGKVWSVEMAILTREPQALHRPGCIATHPLVLRILTEERERSDQALCRMG